MPVARGDDEHLNVPVWRMRQLQDVEQAARECVELVRATAPSERTTLANLATEMRELLEDALGDD